MLRFVFALIYDALALALGLLVLVPLRLLARGRRGPVWIAVELTGDPPWRGAPGGRFRLGARRAPLRPASLEHLAGALERAERDPRVAGAVIKVEQFRGPGAKLDRVAALAARLRERGGKPVAFYGRAVSLREYALMARGSRVQLAPGGQIDLRGYAADLYVLGAPLARAGVGAHFVRREEFKTAPELFTDRAVSEAQRTAAQGLLEALYARAVEAIAQGRGRSPDEVRGWIDDGPYTAARALAAGLVDAVGDGEDLEVNLAAVAAGGSGRGQGAGAARARLLPVGDYRGPSVWPRLKPLWRRRDRIAVVRVKGVIKLGEAVALPGVPAAAGSDSVAAALRRAREDRRVRAIVLAVDSRGGSSLASELVLRAVRRAAERKPVVAYVESIAASGGYMALLGAKRVVAPPAAIVGSIGVFAGKFEISALLERLGVGTAVLRLGRNAGLDSPLLPWTEQERAVLERDVEETYQEFLRAVAEARGRPVEQIRPLAGGRIYTGERALEAGLVDALGDFEGAVAETASLAGVRGRPELVAFEAPRHPLRALRQLGAGGGAAAVAAELARALEALRAMDSERLFALAPEWVNVDPRP